MELTIADNFAAVQKRLDALQQDVGRKALASAMNKTMSLAKTRMQREITKEFAVSAAYVRDRLRIRRASLRGGRLTIEAALIGGDGKRRSANVIAFVEKKASARTVKRRIKAEGERPQLRYQIKRKGGKVVIRGSFIGNAGQTVFERVGRKRLPIRPVRTVDVASMFNARRIKDVVAQMIRDKFPGVFEHEADFYVRRFNAGAGAK